METWKIGVFGFQEAVCGLDFNLVVADFSLLLTAASIDWAILHWGDLFPFDRARGLGFLFYLVILVLMILFVATGWSGGWSRWMWFLVWCGDLIMRCSVTLFLNVTFIRIWFWVIFGVRFLFYRSFGSICSLWFGFWILSSMIWSFCVNIIGHPFVLW